METPNHLISPISPALQLHPVLQTPTLSQTGGKNFHKKHSSIDGYTYMVGIVDPEVANEPCKLIFFFFLKQYFLLFHSTLWMGTGKG